MRQRLPLAEFVAGAGTRTHTSSWIEITQDVIGRFADVTNDHQFIHVDPERAKAETPFGGAIAHGFLTLSLLSAFAIDALPVPEGTAMGINYGFDKIRFLAPVRTGKRVRAHFKFLECSERKPGEMLSRYEVSVEIEGSETPALVAIWLGMVILESKVGNKA